jgi:hypothetical protein
MSNKKILQGHNKALESLATIAAIPLEKAGLTAWAKYNYLPKINLTNPTFKATVTSTGITITEASFDLSLLTEDNYKEILAGFHYKSNSYMHFELNSSGTLYLYSTSSSASEVTGYSNGVITTKTIYNNLGEWDFIYDGEKVFRTESKTLVGYVVSDDENAYPDKAVHTDGYYYEKVEGGITAKMFGCTKMAIDTFAFTADTPVNAAINHSLGEKPKYLFILINAEPASVSATRIKKFIGFGTDNSDLMGYMLYNATSMISVYFVATDTTVKSYTSNYYWYGGIKYTVITMA